MAMKEVQYINNYPICDAEARSQLANKEDKGHKHEEYATSTEVQQIFNSIDINDFDMSDYATKEYVDNAMTNLEIEPPDLSDYALKSEIPEPVEIPTKVSTFENDAEYISFFDIYIKDENGDYLIDEDGNYVIEDMVSANEMEKYVKSEISLALQKALKKIEELENRIQELENK